MIWVVSGVKRHKTGLIMKRAREWVHETDKYVMCDICNNIIYEWLTYIAHTRDVYNIYCFMNTRLMVRIPPRPCKRRAIGIDVKLRDGVCRRVCIIHKKYIFFFFVLRSSYFPTERGIRLIIYNRIHGIYSHTQRCAPRPTFVAVTHQYISVFSYTSMPYAERVPIYYINV